MEAPVKIAAGSIRMGFSVSISKHSVLRGLANLLGLGAVTGIPVVIYKIFVYYVTKKVEQIREENAKFFRNQSGNRRDEGVSIESLAGLCRSNRSNLRRCAQLLAIEKCLNNEKALNHVFHHCLHGNKEQTEKASSILCNALILTDTELDRRPLNFRRAVIQTLAHMIIQSTGPKFSSDVHFQNKIQMLALQGSARVYTFTFLADVEAEDPLPESMFAELCRHLLISLRKSRNRDAHRLALTVMSVIAGDGQLEDVFVNADGMTVICSILSSHQGDAVFQRICLQLISANSRFSESREKLVKEENIVRPLLLCLRSEDPICVNLATSLLHSLLGTSKTCIDDMKAIPSSVRILTRALCNNDMKHRCLVLRIIFMLAADDSEYKKLVLDCSELLEKLSLLYLSSEFDIVTCSLALTECLMLEGFEAVLAILRASPHLLRHLASLAVPTHHDQVIVRMVAEILCLCTSGEVIEESVQAGVLPTIIAFVHVSQSDADVLTQFAAMLLNVALVSDDMKTEMMKCGTLQVLMNLVFSGSGSSSGPGRILASRTLIMLGSNDEPCPLTLTIQDNSGSVDVADSRINFFNGGVHVVRLNVAEWTLKYSAASQNEVLSEEPGVLYVIIIRDFKNLPPFLSTIAFPNQNPTVLISHEATNDGKIGAHELTNITSDSIENLQFRLDILVNTLVRYKLVELTKKAILAIRSPISKVAELNISQGLVHDQPNAEAYLSIPGSVDYLLDMVSAVVDAIPQMENLEPMIAMFAHGIAALEMIEVLVMHERFHELESDIVNILTQLLLQMNRLSLKNSLSCLTSWQRQLYSEYHDIFLNLTKHAIYTIQRLLCHSNKASMRRKLLDSGAEYMVWSALLSIKQPLLKEVAIPSSWTLAVLFAEDHGPSQDSCLLSVEDRTPALQLSPSLLEARNGSWTFESVRATRGTSDVTLTAGKRGWYYEVTVDSGGIIQLGWATQTCPFRAQKGLGVGDHPGSVAFDGERCKKWNGPVNARKVNNNYGKRWAAGDVISCLMTSDGTASYMLNGHPLGDAFTDLPMTHSWFPAASLATDQQVSFNFGAQPFRHPAHEFQPMTIRVGNFREPGFEGDLEQLSTLTIPLSEQSSFHVPVLYFEVNLFSSTSELELGMQSASKTNSKILCAYRNNCLKFPCGKVVCDLMDVEENAPVTLGVGYLLHQSSVFFVVDGTPLRKTYEMDEKEAAVVPYLSSAFVDVNFGSVSFVYDSANDSGLRMGCAALLLDYSAINNR